MAEHSVSGWIEFDVPASDCATVKMALDAIIKDLGGVITAHSYTRDDYDEIKAFDWDHCEDCGEDYRYCTCSPHSNAGSVEGGDALTGRVCDRKHGLTYLGPHPETRDCVRP